MPRLPMMNVFKRSPQQGLPGLLPGLVMLACLLLLPFPSLMAMEDGLYFLRLEHLLHGGARSTGQDLYIELVRRDGQWTNQFWGHSPTYNKAEHHGQLEVIQESDDRVSFSLRGMIADDPWVKGGPFKVDLQLLRQAEQNQYLATFVGKFREQPVNGMAPVERVQAPVRIDALDFASEEHPRVLLRRDQLDALRQAAFSATGQQILARLRTVLEEQRVVWSTHGANAGAHAAGHALLYALTDAKDAADKARELVWVRIRKGVGGPPLFAEAPEVVGVALAYDLCYHYWEPAFRISVAVWLEKRAQALVQARAVMGKMGATTDWNAVLRSAGAFAALAIVKDPGQFSDEPQPPVLHKLSAPAHLPNKGLGEDWKDGRVPKRWFVLGPFANVIYDDVLEDLGGSAQAQLQLKQKVSFDEQTRQVQQLTSKAFFRDQDKDGITKIDLLQPIERTYHSLSCYQSSIRVKKPCLLRFQLGASRAVLARIFIGGQAIKDGDLVQLEPGWYPITIRLVVGGTEDWGKIWMAPRLTAVNPSVAEDITKAGAKEYEAWKARHQAWVAAGRRVMTAESSLRAANRHLRRFIYHGLGDQGWAAAGDAAQVAAARALFPYLYAWQQGTRGKPMLEDAAPGKLLWHLACRLSLIDGKPTLGGFGRGDHVLSDTSIFQLGWFAMDPEQRSMVAGVLDQMGHQLGPQAINDPLTAIFAFLQATAERSAQKVVPPAIVLDKRQGNVLHRSVSLRPDPLVCSMQFGNPESLGSIRASDAGSLRLIGLGSRFLVRGRAGEVENRVQIEGLRMSGPGRLLEHRRVGDQLGITRVDLSSCYRTRSGKPAAVDAVRTVLVDLAEAQGEDAIDGLIVSYDRLQGPGKKSWTINTPAEATITGQQFCLPGKHGAQLIGTVLLPKDASIHARQGQLTIVQAALEQAGKGKDGKETYADDLRFLVVMTMHEDGNVPPPAISLQQQGGQSVITVGERQFQLTGDMVEPKP